ncbi:MAG: hypothetical protein CR984_03260 [Proteobacteria bacterium]|nr:MAG: hypothetical protein CR984_03260 [Pseudomonadota bacterium]PIE67505.1 MAG: hypothetical protein CSA23_03505 [Deltaproteobacteria bacterium]
MKEVVVAVCTPDLSRKVAANCIERLKATDLSLAELLVCDNCADSDFSHPQTMKNLLAYAGSRPIVFIDDDVYVDEPDWLSIMLEGARRYNAAIVGCVHTFESGEVNHVGAMIYRDGTTRMLRELPPDCSTPYVPALSSALMLIMEPLRYGFDTGFEKYHHDTDICLQAWRQGSSVVCLPDVVIIHIQGNYASEVIDVREAFAKDATYLMRKWNDFAASGLFEREALKPFATMASETNWEHRYAKATLQINRSTGNAIEALTSLAAECPINWLAGSAHYHLFRLKGGTQHLEKCLELYPEHNQAKVLLNKLKGEL